MDYTELTPSYDPRSIEDYLSKVAVLKGINFSANLSNALKQFEEFITGIIPGIPVRKDDAEIGKKFVEDLMKNLAEEEAGKTVDMSLGKALEEGRILAEDTARNKKELLKSAKVGYSTLHGWHSILSGCG